MCLGSILVSVETEELSKHMKADLVICFLFAEHRFGGVSAKQQMPLSKYLETAAAPSLSQLKAGHPCKGVCLLCAVLINVFISMV